MIRITPKISVRPDAIRAYMPPVRTPRTAASRTRLPFIGPVDASRPGGLRVLRLGHRRRCRIHRQRAAALPLDEERLAGWPADRVEGHGALHRPVASVVEGVD